jgi:alkanesulfonate monooxygenase SsuD/methylene tetrahydromethanopterin reductase-like flavin-dependent oxidoreductase (luciferase family)
MITQDHRLSFGIKTSQTGIGYDQILRIWREADQIPVLEHAWLWDHMVPLRGEITGAALEAWTLLSALAAQTSRLRLGVIVTSNRLRSPTLLAKMAATVDVIAGGRLVFGIGAGGSRVAVENPAVREFEAYGVPLVSPGEAVRDLAQTCEIARRMWTEDKPFDYDGPSIRLKGAVCEPKPVQRPHPPLTIGTSGERVGLRIAARHAQTWNMARATPEEFQKKSALLDEYCREIGRDPGEIERSIQFLPDAMEGNVTALARDFIAVGATHLIFSCPTPYAAAGARHIWADVVAPLRA